MSNLEIDTPFPVEGTITPRESGYGSSLPCISEWLTESEHGDLLQRAVDRATREYGTGVTVRVRWTGDGEGMAQDFKLLGPTDTGENDD